MNPIPKLLSKTKLLRGYRCLKCIYLTIHHPGLEAPITPEIQALFDQGNRVGAEARKYFPGGVLIDNPPWDFTGALTKTRELLAAKTEVIFEAAFEYMGFYARADVIQYSAESKRWLIYEVKSSTKVKHEHITDAGLQAWIMAKSGLPIEQINIMYLNPECRYPDLSNLFTTQDITDAVRKNYLTIQPKVYEIMTTLRASHIPNIDIGPYCLAPTECGFTHYCWKEIKKIPPLSIFNLPGIKQRKWELYYDGIIALDDPRLSDLNELQERVVTVYKTGKRFVNYRGIQQAMANWQFPLIFLDFETINPAIPRHEECGPFHHVPFQFSVHSWEHLDADLVHQEFLYEYADDPRPALIPALLKACGEQGSIVAYYSQFESDRIEDLAQYSPSHHVALHQLIDRIVDPLPIFRNYVYDNAFAGSFSLKSIAPALLGEHHRYDNMLVANGSDAQRAYEELIMPTTPLARKKTLKNALLAYCQKDTLVMVELVKWLYKSNHMAAPPL